MHTTTKKCHDFTPYDKEAKVGWVGRITQTNKQTNISRKELPLRTTNQISIHENNNYEPYRTVT